MNNRRVNPMASVAAITAAALVGVVVLAVQAAGSAPKVANAAPPQAPHSTASAAPSQAQSPAPPPVDPNALPENSGTGTRIVYRLSTSQVWLVDSQSGKDAVQRVIQVVPATVVAPPGKYKTARYSQSSRGGDGTSVQYVVFWGPNGKYGFDAVSGVSGLPPKPTKPTGGVRMAQDDALAVWSFGNGQIGLPVDVVQ